MDNNNYKFKKKNNYTKYNDFKTFTETTRNSHYTKQFLSFGIIPFLLETKESLNNEPIEIKPNNIYFLMIQRKNTLGYTELIRGKYNKDEKYLQRLVDRMTLNEKKNLLEMDFFNLWNSMWYGKYYTNRYEYNASRLKFEKLKVEGIIEKLVKNSNTQYLTPEWGFPKGRLNKNEMKLECAIREMKEETNIGPNNYNIIKNIKVQTEIHNNYQDKFFINKYYIAKLDSNIKNIIFNTSLTQSQEKEVNQIGLFKYSECMELIRDYDVQRKEIIQNIYNLFLKSLIFSF
jgi:ADP-ribose pyrophosphatase YjhB (NUDIX family)